MKKAVQYVVRSIKYFIYCAIFLTIVLYVLSLANMVQWDINQMFNEGSKSVWKIAAMLAVISAIYPLVGFQKRKLMLAGSWEERKAEIIELMEQRGYRLEKVDVNGATFRYRNVINRFSKMLEDRITITQEFGGFEIEGLRKDVVRLVMHLEYKLNSEL
ncbi:MAG: hypothetical protein II276_04245 [Bacteroidales bacterium]|nr:hypothetical protein [Bacteroidales bacterium]